MRDKVVNLMRVSRKARILGGVLAAVVMAGVLGIVGFSLAVGPTAAGGISGYAKPSVSEVPPAQELSETRFAGILAQATTGTAQQGAAQPQARGNQHAEGDHAEGDHAEGDHDPGSCPGH